MDCTSRSSSSARNLRPREMQGIARYLESWLLSHPISGHKQVPDSTWAPVEFVYRCKKFHSFPALSATPPSAVPLVGSFVHRLAEHRPQGREEGMEMAPGRKWKEMSWDIWGTTRYNTLRTLYGLASGCCPDSQESGDYDVPGAGSVATTWYTITSFMRRYHARAVEVPVSYRHSGLSCRLVLPQHGPCSAKLFSSIRDVCAGDRQGFACALTMERD